MIPVYSIQQWREVVPWTTDAMVEQDLVICRALVSIFSDDFLRENLAFRGGTALHKLYLKLFTLKNVRISDKVSISISPETGSRRIMRTHPGNISIEI